MRDDTTDLIMRAQAATLATEIRTALEDDDWQRKNIGVWLPNTHKDAIWKTTVRRVLAFLDHAATAER